MSVIFLSHSSRDSDLAAEIKEWLAQQEHRSVFLDFDPESGIPSGRSWEQELYRQLRTCRAVVVLSSADSVASRWCFAEITQARALGKTVIPVKKPDNPVDPILHDIQVIDLDRGREEAFRRLERALEVAGIDAGDHLDWDGSRPPYPGLLAFQEEDAAVFFGREAEIGAGLDLLNQARWLASAGVVMLLGASGSGKSSLLRAGLLPRLRRNRQRWLLVGPFKPGNEPLRELAGALAHAFGDPDPAHGWRALHERLAAWRPGGDGDSAPNPLGEVADDLRLGCERSEAVVLVVVDQFEELLGHPEDHPSHRLLSLLNDCAGPGGGPVMVLGTMRSDFLGEFQKHPALRGLEFASQSIGPILEDGLVRVVEEPARLAGVDVDPGLARAVLRDAEGGDALPLVAFTLRELYLRFGRQGRMTVEQYRDRLGGLRGAVARVAESVLPESDELAAIEGDLRRAFVSMARFDDDGRLARSPVPWKEMPASVRPCLERFVEARLLTSRDVAGTPMVEVAHEALFTAWDKLAHWLEESREALAVRREVSRSARLWNDEGRSEDYLWRGGRLHRAAELRRDGQLRLGDEERAFLDAAEAAAAGRRKRKRRRLRSLIAAVSVVAVVTTLLALAAFAGMRRAEIRGAQALAIQARTAGYQIDQALLLAVEAARTLQELGEPDDLHQARTSLLSLLLANPGLETTLHMHRERIESLAVSPDGRLLVSGCAAGRLVVWDLATDRPRFLLDHCNLVARAPSDPEPSCGERIKAMAFSRDGTRLAVGTERGQVVVWATSDFEPEAVLQEAGTVVLTLAFRPYGRQLAMGDIDGHIRVWDLGRPGAPPLELDGHYGVVSGVGFTPDGQRLVSAGRDGSIRLWDLASGEGTTFHRGESAVYSLAVDGDGGIVTGFVDGALRAWNLDGELHFHRPSVHEAQVRDLAVSPDGDIVFSAGLDGAVRFSDARSGAPAWPVSRPLGSEDCGDDCLPVPELGGHVRGATTVAISPDGDTLVTGAGDGTIRLWARGLATQRTIRAPQRTGLTSVAFRTGDLAATGAQDGTIELVRLREGVIRPAVAQQPEEVWGLAFSPDRRFLASASGKLAVRVWALDALEPGDERPRATVHLEHSAHRAWVWSAAFSPDSRLLATSDELGVVELWDVREGRRLPPLETPGSAQSLAFHRHGERLELAVGGKDGTIGIWDPEDGRLLHTLEGHRGPVVDLRFSHRGDRLASAGLDGSVRVWSRGDGWGDRPSLVLREDEDVGVRAIAFSDDGDRLASGDLHGQVRVWDTADGLLRFGIAAHRGAVLGLDFTEEDWLVSGGEDRTLNRWQIGLVESLDEAYEVACRLANRNLDPVEWQQFFGGREYRRTCPGVEPAGSGQRTGS